MRCLVSVKTYGIGVSMALLIHFPTAIAFTFLGLSTLYLVQTPRTQQYWDQCWTWLVVSGRLRGLGPHDWWWWMLDAGRVEVVVVVDVEALVHAGCGAACNGVGGGPRIKEFTWERSTDEVNTYSMVPMVMTLHICNKILSQITDLVCLCCVVFAP